MLRRSLLPWLLLSSLIAALWPNLFGAESFDPFFATKPYLGWLVAITMFCVGAVLPKQEVLEVFRRWKLVASGTLVQYLSMPFLAWSLTKIFGLEGDLRIGVIIVGCVPGAMASNVLTMLARGHVSYSVGLTTLATLISPIVVPLALKLTLGATASPELLINSAILLCVQIVIPTFLGFGLSGFSSRFAAWASRWAETLASVSILWIIAVVMGLNREWVWGATTGLAGILLMLNVGGYIAGGIGGRLFKLSPAMRRALVLEVGMQNAGVGASLATSLFPEAPQAALPCGLFAFGCMLTGTILAQIYSRFPPTEPATTDNNPQPAEAL